MLSSRCRTHQNREFEFICRAATCDMTILCALCRRDHVNNKASNKDRDVHLSQIVPLRQAQEEAEKNVTYSLKRLRDMIKPFENERVIFEKIERQKEELIRERDRIISEVRQQFDSEIRLLNQQNSAKMRESQSRIPFNEINDKIRYLENLLKQSKKDEDKLKQCLRNHQQQQIDVLAQRSNALSSINMEMNEYFIYENTRHDFELTKLQLSRKTINNKLLQKVKNPSDLYFLIEDYKQGKYLHYLSHLQNELRVYNLQTEKWLLIKCEVQGKAIPAFASSVFEPRSQTFYIVGGGESQKTNQILVYSMRDKKWSVQTMATARSSAMVTIVYGPAETNKYEDHYLMIVGGMGHASSYSQEAIHLKSCQLYKMPEMKSRPVLPMNYAVSSGTVVTFRDSIVFRIGGLGQMDRNSSSRCEIAEKCDLAQYLKENSSDGPRWTYVDIEAVNSQIINRFSLFYAHQAAIQINPNEILVFGGLGHNSKGVDECYIIQVQSIKVRPDAFSYRYYARWINEKPLVTGDGFINLRPIVFNKKVMSLQTISKGLHQYMEKEKRLVEFDMHEWKEIENIAYF